MAQRATRFARKTAEARPSEGVLARAIAEPSDELRAVPLEILPLIAPYKGRGRLSIRIEKLPIQARLSRGRNNGDRSYSLMLDELEDLAYLAPEGPEPAPVLALRIISLDEGDASTIALRDLPVAFGEIEEEFGGEDGLSGVSSADVRRLIDELTRAKSTLAIREIELADARLKA